MAEPEEMIEPPQSSVSSGQDEQLENTVPSVSTEDVGGSTPWQQSPGHTYEQYVQIALQQVSDFMLEESKSTENDEHHQSQLPHLDTSMDQQKTTQEDDKFASEISEPELLDCLVHKLEEIISSQEDKKQDNLTENELPEKLQPQFDNTHNLPTLSQDLFLSDSSQEYQVEQAINLESDIIISDVYSLGKTPVKNENQIETEEEIWNEDSMQELQELEELGYNVVVPTQPKTQESETSVEAKHDSQTKGSTVSLLCNEQMLSSQESCDQLKLNVQICPIPLESLEPLFHESNDIFSEQSVTEKSPELFTSGSSQDPQFENDSASQTNTESNIIISNVCSLSTNVVNTTEIGEKNTSQDSFGEILDDDFAQQLQELEEFGYEVVAPTQSEINTYESCNPENNQSSLDDMPSNNEIYGNVQDVARDTKMQETNMGTNTIIQDGGDQNVNGSINNSINMQQKTLEPLLSSQEINTQTKDSQDSCCATAMSENKTVSRETPSSKSSGKKGSSSKISEIIDEFLDSYADEIGVDDMNHVDMDTDCDLHHTPPQLADNSTPSSSNSTKSPLRSNQKSSQCHEEQICFSSSKHDKELKDTADLLIGKQPFCSEMKIAIPNEAIATEACLPNPCSMIASYSTDTATLPEQSSSASMPTESLTASNTTLSNDEGKDSNKKTRSMFIQTDATPVDTTATQTEKIVGSDMSTQTSLTMQQLDVIHFETETPSQINEEENKPRYKIRTRSTTSKEWTENTDPETSSSQGSNEGLSANKRAKRKCTQEHSLSEHKVYPRSRKPLIPFSNDQEIATVCSESSVKKDMEKGNVSKRILSDDKSVKNNTQKTLMRERKIFKEVISTSVGRKASESPKCKERRVSSQIHSSDNSSPGSSGKNSPISSPMIYQKKGSPDSSDSASSQEQKARKCKKLQEQVVQAGSSSPSEAKKKKLSQGECSMRLRSEPHEPARKGLRLGLSRCAKLKSLLKKH